MLVRVPFSGVRGVAGGSGEGESRSALRGALPSPSTPTCRPSWRMRSPPPRRSRKPSARAATSPANGSPEEPPPRTRYPARGFRLAAHEAVGDARRRLDVPLASPEPIAVAPMSPADVRQVVAAEIGDRQLAEDVVEDRGRVLDRVVALHDAGRLEAGEGEGLDVFLERHAVLQAERDGDGEIVHQRCGRRRLPCACR